jgi:hypothetical protein
MTQMMTMAHTSTTTDHAAGVSNRQAAGPDAAQEASEEPFPASNPRSRTPVPGGSSSPETQVVRQCGRFTLTKSPEGLRWVLTSRAGSVWYWHPESRQWLATCRAYRTEKEATAGIEETLAHEQAGDLDEQHAAPPPGHGPRQQ